MKVALIRPALPSGGERHLAYGSDISPMATPLALLEACLREKHPEVDVSILNENRSFGEITRKAADFDLVGFSTTYASHGIACEMAKEIFTLNPEVKIIFGGIDAANKGRQILSNHPYIDYVCGNQNNPWGENVINDLMPSAPESISNIWMRKSGEVEFTGQAYNLKNLPLWDFSRFEDHDERIQPYLKPAGDWDLPHHSVFSWRGCLKALRRGRCSFCTSAVGAASYMFPEVFWTQIFRLQEKEFPRIKMNLYLGDNHISPEWAKKLADKRPSNVSARFRAYGWLPEIIALSPERLNSFAKDLGGMNFYNLFYGIESFDEETVLRDCNKDFISVQDTARVINTLFHEGGVRATIAIIIGLTGETERSLRITLESFQKLLDIVSRGAIERIYISHLVVLHGSAIMNEMKCSRNLSAEYGKMVGKSLGDDDNPSVDLLTALHLKYFTGITPAVANDYHDHIVSESLEAGIPRQQIGGFEDRHIICDVYNRL